MKSQKEAAKQQQEQIAELKIRRVKLWKIYHTLPDTDERKEKVRQAAMGLTDGLRAIGALCK
jgi:hypothetical protein